MAIRPWKKDGEPEVLAAGYRKKFVRQWYIDPDGGRHDFLQYVQPPSIVVMIVTVSSHVLVLREFMQGAGEIIEWLGGGLKNAGETIEDAVHREVLEETGHRVGRLISLGPMWVIARHSPTPVDLYLATECVRVSEQHLDPGEDIEIVPVPLDDWIARAVNGQVTCGFSSTITLRALPHLGLKITR